MQSYSLSFVDNIMTIVAIDSVDFVYYAAWNLGTM